MASEMHGSYTECGVIILFICSLACGSWWLW